MRGDRVYLEKCLACQNRERLVSRHRIRDFFSLSLSRYLICYSLRTYRNISLFIWMYYISIVRILLVISQYCNCSCMIQRGLGTFSGIMSSSHHYLLTDFSGAFLIRNDKFLSVEKWPINFLKGRCSKIYLCDQFGEKRIRGKINCISQTRIARNLSRYRHCVLDRSFESWPKMFRTLFKIKHVLQIWRFVNRRVITPVNFVICVTWRHSKWKKKKKKNID